MKYDMLSAWQHEMGRAAVLIFAAVAQTAEISAVPPASLLVCGNDQTFSNGGGVERVLADPKAGSLTFVNVSQWPPGVWTDLPNVPLSLVGPPTCISVTPDRKLVLVAGAMKRDPEHPTVLCPDNRITVVSTGGNTPKVLQTLQVGRQPSGLEISRDGKRALVANRADGSVSLLAIDGESVTLAKTFSVAEPEASVSHATFSPTGSHVLISLNKRNKVLFCSLENDTLKPIQEVEVGNGPYALRFVDEKCAVVANLHDGTLSVLRVSPEKAAVVDCIPVGILVEGIDLSPDACWLIANCLENSAKNPSDPTYRSTGMVVLLERTGDTFMTSDIVRVPAIPQGANFLPDGNHIAVGSNAERSIRFYEIQQGRLRDTEIVIPCSGGPAAMAASPAEQSKTDDKPLSRGF